MRVRSGVVAAVTAVVATAMLTAGTSASANPYNERCGDGTPHGCVLHCMRDHRGERLEDCLYGHWLV